MNNLERDIRNFTGLDAAASPSRPDEEKLMGFFLKRFALSDSQGVGVSS
jgi:hypothetical protein